MLQLRHLFLNEEKCAVSSRDKGTFNEYMDKKRWVGGPKRFFSRFRVKQGQRYSDPKACTG